MSGLPLEAPDPPATLGPEAQARWRSVWPRVAAATGGAVDLATLEAYCQVWARWREAENALARAGQLVRKERGGAAPSPLVTVSSQAGVQVRALEQRLGLAEPARRPVAAAPAGPLSLRAYGRLRGVSAVAVSRAVKSGRLSASVVYDHLGDPKIGDAALADQEWNGNTDLTRAPAAVKERGALGPGGVQTSAHAPAPEAGAVPGLPAAGDAPPPPAAEAGGQLTLAEASAEEKRWRARLAELDYRRKAGEYVDAREVADRLASVFTICRTKLLALPSKAKGAIPALTHADVATLDDLVRQALEELAVAQVTGAAPPAAEGAA